MDLEPFSRILVALLLSGLLGWEREVAGKSAGIRTHMLVGLGAALFVIIAEVIILRFSGNSEMQFDPVRIVEAIVTGISFLGAGTIFVSRGEDRVEGLTTAASILVTAGVGMMAGLHQFHLAIGTTLIVFVVLHTVGYLTDKISARKKKAGPTDESSPSGRPE